MKKIFIFGFIGFVTMLYLGSSVDAEKRLDVMMISNGYPSGPHHNLNMHGVKDEYNCNPTEGGNSIFIREYGTSLVEFVWNRKADIMDLTVLDKCAEWFDGDAARVQIPWEAEGYYLLGRLRAKPNNSKDPNDRRSHLILKPNPILKACDDAGADGFADLTECDGSLITLGLITQQGVYKMTEAGFYRFEDNDAKGKGKGKAKNITKLLLWTGWVFQDILDTSGPDGVPDGVVDEDDVPLSYDTNPANGVIDPAELEAWLQDQITAGTAEYLVDQWVWNIADLVIQEQEILNDGGKLFKLRWYPVATTIFIP